jgi:hydroxymethylbilane synthase
MLRLATRGSRLALWQAERVRALLAAAHAGLELRVDVVRTTGDRRTDAPLANLGATGLFTSELDARVRAGEADAAVHSLKDVPTVAADGLRIAAVLARADPRDAYVPAPGRARTLLELHAGARVGTSSLRRRALLRALRPDLEVVDLRGNIDTRLERLEQNRCDAAILACAGLIRLGREDVVGEILEAPPWLPAAGQGAIAVIARTDDDRAASLLAPLAHAHTTAATSAERSFLRRLQGGCQVPIGALARIDGAALALDGFLSDTEGAAVLRGHASGASRDAERIGDELAAELLERGGAAILDGVRAALPPSAP